MQQRNKDTNDKEERNGDKMNTAIGSLTQRFRRMVRCLQRLLLVCVKADSPADADATLIPHVGHPDDAHRVAHEPPASSAGSGIELLGDVVAQATPSAQRAEYSTWWPLLQAFPGDDYPNPSTQSAMRSGASMWVFHALANGLDPGHRDWSEVEKMLASSGLKFATKRSYRSHIRRWFEWCDKHRDEWGRIAEAA